MSEVSLKNLVKKKMRYCAVPNAEVWRTILLTDLLKAKDNIDVVPVARLEYFRALKFSRLESFRALNSYCQVGGF